MRNVISVMRDAMRRAGVTPELIERTVAVIEDDRRAQNRARQRKYHAEHNANGVTNANNVIPVKPLKVNAVPNANRVIRPNNIIPSLKTSLGGVEGTGGRGGGKRPIDPNFRPSDQDWAKWQAKTGFDDARMRLETSNFRNHWLAKGERRPNWDASWRTWMGKAAVFKPVYDRAYVSPVMATMRKIQQEVEDGRFGRRNVCNQGGDDAAGDVHPEAQRRGDLREAVDHLVHGATQRLVAKTNSSR